MNRTIRFTTRAGRQIDEALDWWTRNRSLAPTLLADELDHALSLITSFPESGTPGRAPQFKSVRRVTLPKSHYALFYRVRDDAIEVVALWHQHRGSHPVGSS